MSRSHLEGQKQLHVQNFFSVAQCLIRYNDWLLLLRQGHFEPSLQKYQRSLFSVSKVCTDDFGSHICLLSRVYLCICSEEMLKAPLSNRSHMHSGSVTACCQIHRAGSKFDRRTGKQN